MAGGRAAGPGGRAPEAAAEPETREFLFKVLVVGEQGVGKTSVIQRYVHQLFSQHYRATVGVDFALKVLAWDPRTRVRLQLWDIADIPWPGTLRGAGTPRDLFLDFVPSRIQENKAFLDRTYSGQERFGNMTRVYYKEASGAFVVFDISEDSALVDVLKWKSDLDSKVHLPNGSPIPVVLLANKCDRKKHSSQSPAQMDRFCWEHGFISWFETSAKDNINIDEAARFLVGTILANQQSSASEEHEEGTIKLHQDPQTAGGKSQCC